MGSEFTLDEIDEAAIQFLKNINDQKVIAFHGEMGVGKTTFISAVCKALGTTGKISSPTFSIINAYKMAVGVIYHIDLYRLKDEREAIDAGVEDCLYSGNVCLVEWPEKAARLFTENTVHVYLNLTGINTRKLRINL
ncbi:MAG TPA: tRNA (adenosine(37)-N6)-threonylcarbamoyltransferase complex ATPase subunit type 1 TsaE [Ferruginibacter sp.]|nr:tRNA (adenosine(37)-N6)-threonylcarbamoyltransferase complex ATPase subunit type 1 TsaE [Ferruginibacter sp.]